MRQLDAVKCVLLMVALLAVAMRTGDVTAGEWQVVGCVADSPCDRGEVDHSQPYTGGVFRFNRGQPFYYPDSSSPYGRLASMQELSEVTGGQTYETSRATMQMRFYDPWTGMTVRRWDVPLGGHHQVWDAGVSTHHHDWGVYPFLFH